MTLEQPNLFSKNFAGYITLHLSGLNDQFSYITNHANKVQNRLKAIFITGYVHLDYWQREGLKQGGTKHRDGTVCMFRLHNIGTIHLNTQHRDCPYI